MAFRGLNINTIILLVLALIGILLGIYGIISYKDAKEIIDNIWYGFSTFLCAIGGLIIILAIVNKVFSDRIIVGVLFLYAVIPLVAAIGFNPASAIPALVLAFILGLLCLNDLKSYMIPSMPSKPTISGPSIGNQGVPLTISVRVDHPGGLQMRITVDWDDGTQINIRPVTPGLSRPVDHTYAYAGHRSIRVQATDTNGNKGPWSDEFMVTIH